MGDSMQTDSLLDQLLEEVHQLRLILSGRLSSLENNVCYLSSTCTGMASRVEGMEGLLQRTHDVMQRTHDVMQSSDTIVGQRCSSRSSEPDSSKGSVAGVLATAAGVLRLPGMEDYPDGTWLGDPDCPSNRVRSPITPQNLLHINSTCVTAEKMALTLLDYLFSRDELASSNISGRSRNNKKQLDPMMVYGIRCHLHYKFNITVKEWNRICQNMDSKCRSAWKRKIKNLGLHPQESHHNKLIKVCHGPLRAKDSQLSEDISFDFDQLHATNLDLSCVKVINDSSGELRILHSDAGSLDTLPATHEIVLAEDRILGDGVEKENGLIIHRSDSSGDLDMAPVVITSNAVAALQTTALVTSSIQHCASLRHSDLAPSVQQRATMHRATTTGGLQRCSVSLASSSLSLQQCSVDADTVLDQSPQLDTGEAVIVIAGEPTADDSILEIGVSDTLQQHSLHDSPSSSPSPPSYKLLPQPHTSFHPSLQMHSSSIKHEMGDQDISDDLDESMRSIHQSPLPHLSINTLRVMRVKGDMDLKELKVEETSLRD